MVQDFNVEEHKSMNVEITNYDKIIQGLNLTYKRLIEFKKSKNSPLVVSKDGKIVHEKYFNGFHWNIH